MIDMRSLEIFYWTAELNSFSRAAEHLHASQPSISQRISALEEELGIRLLDRTSRAVRLTVRGRVLFEYAEQFLRLHNRMIAEVASADRARGVVRLGVSETIVHTWLSEFLDQVHKRFPNVVVDMTVDISPIMLRSILERDIDMAFMLGPVNEPHILSVPVGKYPLRFVARPGLLASGSLSDEDFARYPIVTYPKSTYPFTAIRERISRRVAKPPRIFTNSSLSTIIRMALDGIGIALVPPVVVKNELEQGVLVILESDIELAPFAFFAAYPQTLDNDLLEKLAGIAHEASLIYNETQ